MGKQGPEHWASCSPQTPRISPWPQGHRFSDCRCHLWERPWAGEVAECMCCFCWGPDFSSQHPWLLSPAVCSRLHHPFLRIIGSVKGSSWYRPCEKGIFLLEEKQLYKLVSGFAPWLSLYLHGASGTCRDRSLSTHGFMSLLQELRLGIDDVYWFSFK